MNLIYEIIGYLGTGFVILSMTMSSMKRLRLFNVLGAILSGAYAILIGAYPVLLLNACLALINIFHLIKDYRRGENQ